MGTPDQSPSSWRDVYQLVRDTREDVLGAVAVVDGKVTALGDRVTGIENDRHDEKVARQVETELAAKRDALAVKQRAKLTTIAGIGRGTIAIIISVASFVLVVVKS